MTFGCLHFFFFLVIFFLLSLSTASKGFWAQTLGVGDFYYEVSRRVFVGFSREPHFR